MTRHQRIWLAFSASAGLMVAILAWVAAWTLRLERERAGAQRELQAGRDALELEERINSALWRLDSWLSLLIGREAARDPADYELFLPAGVARYGKDPALAPQPSPLLEQPSEFIRLHFQVFPDGSVTSPQAPEGTAKDLAIGYCEAPPESLNRNDELLAEARQFFHYESMLAACPAPDDSRLAGIETWQVEKLRIGQAIQSSAVDANPLWAHQSAPLQLAGPDGEASEDGDPDRGIGASNPGRNAPAAERDNRSRAMQSQNMIQNARVALDYLVADSPIRAEAAGLLRPFWAGHELVLARAVRRGGGTVVQCCWLDWPRLSGYLRDSLYDLFPEVELVPVSGDMTVNPARTLTTLPVELRILPVVEAAPAGKGPAPSGGLWPALLAAGGASILAIGALGMLLAGVMRLGDRQATFASAVSHELRTPLTTFRMYSEMLADGMVRDPARQAEYLQTLRSESERLGHLVDNVLAYSGLQNRRQNAARERIRVSGLVERLRPVLRQIAQRGGRPLVEAFDPAALETVLETDPAAVERILVNLVDNAVKYGVNPSRPEITWSIELPARGRLAMAIRDHGPGIPRHRRRQVFSPFSRGDSESAGQVPGAGLGLALSRKIAGDLGGNLKFCNDSCEATGFVLLLPCKAIAT